MSESTPKNGQKTEINNEQQTKVKLNNINLAELQKQHKVYQLYAEISEFRLRQVMADARYIEFVAKFNTPPPNAENNVQEEPMEVLKEKQKISEQY